MNNTGRMQPGSPTPGQARESDWQSARTVQPGAVSIIILSGGELRSIVANMVSDVLDRLALLNPPPAPVDPPASPAGGFPEYVDTKQAAALLGVSAAALESLRARGKGPPFIRIGKRVRYAVADLRKGNRDE